MDRHVLKEAHTPNGGLRVVEQLSKDGKLLRVTYYDSNGIAQAVEWLTKPWWTRILDAICRFKSWLFERFL